MTQVVVDLCTFVNVQVITLGHSLNYLALVTRFTKQVSQDIMIGTPQGSG